MDKKMVWHAEQGPVYVPVEPKRVHFADEKRRVEVTAGKHQGELGWVWFKNGEPERRVSAEGYAWALKSKRKYLMVTFDSGFSRPIQERRLKYLSELETLCIEADDDMPDAPPRLEDIPEDGKRS